MNPKQNPFSLYDFLGYLLPGALFIYLVLIGYPVLGISLGALPNPHPSLFKHPDGYIPFVIAAYVIGHILSYLSSLTVERYSIWAFGYPSQFLLGSRPKTLFDGVNGNTNIDKRRRLLRRLVTVACFPFTSLDAAMERFCNFREIYAKSLDKKLVLIIQRKIWLLIMTHAGIHVHCKEKRINAHSDISRSDFFRLVYHYALEACPNHVASLKNYVSLYGFLRTIALLCVFGFWVSLAKLFIIVCKVSINGYASITLADEKIGWLIMFTCSFWVLSYIFMMAFVKFYRRYTLEAFMALAATYPPEVPSYVSDTYASDFLDKSGPEKSSRPQSVP